MRARTLLAHPFADPAIDPEDVVDRFMNGASGLRHEGGLLRLGLRQLGRHPLCQLRRQVMGESDPLAFQPTGCSSFGSR